MKFQRGDSAVEGQEQGRVVVTGTVWPTNLQVLTMRTLTESVRTLLRETVSHSCCRLDGSCSIAGAGVCARVCAVSVRARACVCTCACRDRLLLLRL